MSIITASLGGYYDITNAKQAAQKNIQWNQFKFESQRMTLMNSLFLSKKNYKKIFIYDFFFLNENIHRFRGTNLAKETQLQKHRYYSKVYKHNNFESVQGKPRHTTFCIMMKAIARKYSMMALTLDNECALKGSSKQHFIYQYNHRLPLSIYLFFFI